MLIIDQKIFFKFSKISILWPFTFYSDPALAYCGSWPVVKKCQHGVSKSQKNMYLEALLVCMYVHEFALVCSQSHAVKVALQCALPLQLVISLNDFLKQYTLRITYVYVCKCKQLHWFHNSWSPLFRDSILGLISWF